MPVKQRYLLFCIKKSIRNAENAWAFIPGALALHLSCVQVNILLEERFQTVDRFAELAV